MHFHAATDLDLTDERALGEGAHAAVIRAESREYGDVALKIFKDQQSFARELAHYRALIDDNRWPSCYATSEFDGKPSLVLSYENIASLYQFSMERRTSIVDGIEAADMLDYIIRCMSAIGDMHKATGRAHNDLHYKNFGLGYDRQERTARVVIFDFGLSEKMNSHYDFAQDANLLLFYSKFLIRRKATDFGREWLDVWSLLDKSDRDTGRHSRIYGIDTAHSIAKMMKSLGADILCRSALDQYARDRFDTSLAYKVSKGINTVRAAFRIPQTLGDIRQAPAA